MAVKISAGTLLLVAALGFVLAVYMGWVSIPDFTPGTTTPGPSTPSQPSQGDVSVTRTIKFTVTDKYAGSAITSGTIKIYKGKVLQESLTTDASGQATSGKAYTSGEQLNVQVVKSNSKAWYTITVPYMSPSDVDAMAYNPVGIDFFSLDTSVTLKVTDGQGTAYSSGGSLNWTSLGTTEITLTIQGYVSADNKGYIDSYDPLNGINWYPVLYGKLYNTNYELLSLNGWDSRYERGSAMWHAARIDATGVTKWKVGDEYVYPGSFSKTFTLKKGSYSGDVADLVLYLYAYSDPGYHNSYGSYGPDSVAMASAFTLNIVD